MTHTYRRRIVCCFFVCHVAGRKNRKNTFALEVFAFVRTQRTELMGDAQGKGLRSTHSDSWTSNHCSQLIKFIPDSLLWLAELQAWSSVHVSMSGWRWSFVCAAAAASNRSTQVWNYEETERLLLSSEVICAHLDLFPLIWFNKVWSWTLSWHLVWDNIPR